jgi:hypothetical protein
MGWPIVIVFGMVALVVVGSVAVGWVAGKKATASVELQDWSNRVMKTLPEDVLADLRENQRGRLAVVLGCLILFFLVGFAFLGGGMSEPGRFGEWPARLLVAGLVLFGIGLVTWLSLTRAREGETLLDLGAHPLEAAFTRNKWISLTSSVFVAVMFGTVNRTERPMLAVFCCVAALAAILVALLGKKGVRLTEGGVRLMGQFTPWKGLDRPTWGEGKSLLALRRTRRWDRFWQSWVVVPIPEGQSAAVDAALAQRLPAAKSTGAGTKAEIA